MNTDNFTSAALATAVIGFMIQTLVPAEPQALAAPSQAGNFSCDEKIEAQRLKVPSELGPSTRFCETPAGQQSLGAHPMDPAQRQPLPILRLAKSTFLPFMGRRPAKSPTKFVSAVQLLRE